MGDGRGLLDSTKKVVQVGKASGYYWRERYDAQGAGYGVSKYCEYPADLITIVERFLLGVNFRLDGSLEIAPVAPDSYWDAGFGQTLVLPGRTLSYSMWRNGMNGDYFGEVPQTLRVKLPGGTASVTINEQPAAATQEGGLLVFELPAADAAHPCHFVVSVSAP